jgi:hypothetical protein
MVRARCLQTGYRDEVTTSNIVEREWSEMAPEAEVAIRAMQPAPLPVVRFKDGERDV